MVRVELGMSVTGGLCIVKLQLHQHVFQGMTPFQEVRNSENLWGHVWKVVWWAIMQEMSEKRDHFENDRIAKSKKR